MGKIHNKYGFTLFELLVAITVVAVLASLLLPVLSLVRDASRTTRCAGNGRQLWTANMTYANNWNGMLVPWETNGTWWAWTIHEYVETNAKATGNFAKTGYNVLADCPDWRPGKTSIWNGFYSLQARDMKSLSLAYNQRPLREPGGSWKINGYAKRNNPITGILEQDPGWGYIRWAQVSSPDQRIAYWDANEHDEDPTPSRTNREGSSSNPMGSGGTRWKHGQRHRGRPNWVLFSGRIVRVTTVEQGKWAQADQQNKKVGGWIEQGWASGQVNNSAYNLGLNNPQKTHY